MPLSLPSWITKHLYPEKNFDGLSSLEILDLKNRLSKHKAADPDVSIVIPAWNEGDNIYRTLSSLSDIQTKYKTEIIVINNNSTDHTQEVLTTLEVLNYFQPEQGISFARQLGLEKAKGKYHLCADSDTFYPPTWVDSMIEPMEKHNDVTGVYGRYSFIPPAGENLFFLKLYETVTGALIRLRKYKREHINVLGFNMGFITEVGKTTGGFKVTQARKFDNSKDSASFVDESEDGRMAINLKKKGKLFLITSSEARVFTSSRRLISEGGIYQSFINRLKLHSKRITEYIAGKSPDHF